VEPFLLRPCVNPDFWKNMALFLSTYVNKVDKKGRVSVPASFRAAIQGQPFNGIVVFCSNRFPCLEGFSWSTMDEIGDRLDEFDLFSGAQEDLAMSIFGDCHQLAFDGEGRIVIPESLMKFSGMDYQAAFVGLGRKFQIWEPKAYEQRRGEARSNVQDNKLTIPAPRIVKRGAA
jgi:MraZ protein